MPTVNFKAIKWQGGIEPGPICLKYKAGLSPKVFYYWLNLSGGFSAGSVVKSPPANAGDAGSIPGSRRSSGEGNGNPIQYFCLGYPMDRGAWWAIVHEVARVRQDFVTKPPPPNITDALTPYL